MQETKIAIVTMVYNEADYLPIWTNYYGRQIGLSNLFVVDHGSTDGSTSGLGDVNILRIPRSPQDDPKRAAFISKLCSSLLDYYDFVIYIDVDEIAVADPRYHANLATFCGTVSKPILNAIGINVIHRMGHELAFDPTRGVLDQRSWVFSSSSMCKPILIRRPVQWAQGFHSADAPAAFDNLYLFHLRWFDLDTGLRRLAKTRTMAWQHADAGGHQRVSDDELIQQFTGFSSLPPDDRDWDLKREPVSTFVNAVLQSQIGRENDLFRISLDIWPNTLWRVPERFRTIF
jgi:glycosyltransferase involved in cell wall biosynthesis